MSARAPERTNERGEWRRYALDGVVVAQNATLLTTRLCAEEGSLRAAATATK